ncbi:recombinase RecT [Herminiimonas contaminans]|uniref:Recombinase RecT n=1 Tax=Herminiimonas contaminans TaxID=1111140 RepID=A0ABS0EQT4_9BURK|nr:RecT family recombinase [Herminiimonas contaminans]MBF8177220.1 recombinase RecT [Herminiimonas contaminans]
MSQLTTTTQENPIAVASAAMMMNPEHMRALVSFSEMMAKSAVTVPKHLQGKPADCLAISMQAAQWGMNPFAVAQKTHLVNGVLGYEAQLVNAVIQSSGAIKGAFQYEYKGEANNLECRVGAVLHGNTEVTWGEWLRKIDVTTQNSPLWKSNPKQQLGYLQVKNWARLYCPGAILGVYTDDELVDAGPVTREMGTAQEVSAARTERPAYAADQFAKNLPAWTKLITDGKKTPDQIIATVQSKATLSDDQKRQILNIKPATVIENEAEQTHEKHPLEAQMDNAENEDDLHALADQIRGINDPDDVKFLTEVYKANLERLTKG